MLSSLSSDYLGILVVGNSEEKLVCRRKHRPVLLATTAARLYRNRDRLVLSVSNLGPSSEG